MDGDSAVEPALDTFGLILPLPYRVALILVAGGLLTALLLRLHFSNEPPGVWAWGLNLHYLSILRIVCLPRRFIRKYTKPQ